jgi:hypothetical protein
VIDLDTFIRSDPLDHIACDDDCDIAGKDYSHESPDGEGVFKEINTGFMLIKSNKKTNKFYDIGPNVLLSSVQNADQDDQDLSNQVLKSQEVDELNASTS